MGHYKANSINSQNFVLTIEGQQAGELIYKKWYSFNAEIILSDGSIYQLNPKGFWDATIELKKDSDILLEFKMGWKGIMIKTFFNNKEETYLLKLNGLLSSKYVLVDTNQNVLMVTEIDFKWNKLRYDYNMETSETFDSFNEKELLLLTILHCINYYVTIMVSAT